MYIPKCVLFPYRHVQYCAISDRRKSRAWYLLFISAYFYRCFFKKWKASMSEIFVLFLILSMWLSRDRCTRHRISRLLSKVNVNNKATPRRCKRSYCFSVPIWIKTARNFTKIGRPRGAVVRASGSKILWSLSWGFEPHCGTWVPVFRMRPYVNVSQ